MNEPIKTAAEWAIESGTGGNNFYRLLSWHLQHGIVFSGNDCFLMARPIPKERVYQDGGTLKFWDKSDCDTWYVWLAAGKNCLSRLLEIAPYKLPYVAWHREKQNTEKLKFWSWEHYEKVTNKFRRKTNG